MKGNSTSSRPRRSGLAPPRKKTCSQCEKSKVRCDLKKPTCSRCETRRTRCQYPAGAGPKYDAPSHNQGSSSIPVTDNILQTPSTTAAPSLQGARNRTDTTTNSVIATESPPRNFLRRNPLHQPSRFTVSFSQGQTNRSATHQPWSTSDIPPILAEMDSAGETFEIPTILLANPDTSVDMEFEHLDLIPMANADEILDRWTRPYLNMSTPSAPKDFQPYTIQYTTRILKSYVSKLNSFVMPPFIHHQQLTGNVPQTLANCFSLVRSWLNRTPGNRKMIKRQIFREMGKMYDQVHLSQTAFRSS